MLGSPTERSDQVNTHLHLHHQTQKNQVKKEIGGEMHNLIDRSERAWTFILQQMHRRARPQQTQTRRPLFCLF